MSIENHATTVAWPRRHVFADSEVPQTYVFYDIETTGLDPNYDQITQIAAIRTDAEFNIIDELEHIIDIRCRRLPWVVPSPQALLTTRVQPDDLDHEEHLPQEVMAIVAEKFQDWSPAVFIGYNSIRFDDEFLRRGFLSALLNPYLVPGPGSLRADLMQMVQAAHVMVPGALFVPPLCKHGQDRAVQGKLGDTSGTPADCRTFRLQALAEANGIAGGSEGAGGKHPHDALADVRTCIALAKLLKRHASDVFELILANASKWYVTELLERSSLSEPPEGMAAGHQSHDPHARSQATEPANTHGFAYRDGEPHRELLEPADLDEQGLVPLALAKIIGGETIVTPVMGLLPSPVDHGRIIAADLNIDPAIYLDLSVEALEDYCRANRWGFVSIKANAQPILMALSASAPSFPSLMNRVNVSMGEDGAAYPGGALDLIELRMRMILKAGAPFTTRLSQALAATRRIYHIPVHIDEQLYSGGFIARTDALLAERMSDMEVERMAEHISALRDPRLQEHALRWVFAEDPHALSIGRREVMRQMLRTRLLGPPGMPWRTIAQARKELLGLQMAPILSNTAEIGSDRRRHLDAIALWLHRLEQAHLNPSAIFAPRHDDA